MAGVADSITAMFSPSAPPRTLRIALSTVSWFNLLSALAGMLGLTLGGGLGFPLKWIQSTGFTSYFWPGIILGVLVGGAQALALIAQYGRFALAWALHAAAGLVMMLWIFTEIAIIVEWFPLQGVYFATGLIQTVLALLALGAWPTPFLHREVKAPPP